MHRLVRALAASLCLVPLGASRLPAPGAFAAFVDSYLDEFARRHPSIAAGNGIHMHDNLLEDFSPSAVVAEIAKLKDQRAFLLTRTDTTALTPDERVDRLILLGIIDGWLLEQETLKNWQRNPMQYRATTDGRHDLMTMESAPAPSGCATSSPNCAACHAARRGETNIHNPPRIFAQRGAASMRGASDARAISTSRSRPSRKALRDSLRRAADAAIPLISAYATYLEKDVIPNANGDFTIGAANLSRRYVAEEMIDTPLDTMVAIGERELRASQPSSAAPPTNSRPGRIPSRPGLPFGAITRRWAA